MPRFVAGGKPLTSGFRYENFWYPWKAAAYGLEQDRGVSAAPLEENSTSAAPLEENMFDLAQNFPFWFGPWAGGMALNVSQQSGGRPLSQLSFRSALVPP